MTPDELAAARWFRAKHRPIASLRDVDRAPLGPGELVVVEVAYLDGGQPDRYLVPLVDGREPADGEGMWSALVEAIGTGSDVRGSHGWFVAGRTDGVGAPPTSSLAERRVTVEQSNTSVVIGDRVILKLYRLLEPGANPEVEVVEFLTRVGFADTPALAGMLTYQPGDGEPAAAAMLQAYVPSTGDAWALMLDTLGRDAEDGVALAGRIGTLTAAMHGALGSRPEEPAFPARPASVAETAWWRASAERQLAEAVSAVSGPAHDRLVALAPAVSARFADTFGRATGAARVTRIHGDYHLGQLLARVDGGLSVIDFEGEPGRPLAERRLPGSPLRDVAGMLRSLDYAARTAGRASGLDAVAWLPRAREALLAAYGSIGASDAELLAAFELEKACYEVRYEASNRPDWLWLPLDAVGRLAAA